MVSNKFIYRANAINAIACVDIRLTC